MSMTYTLPVTSAEQFSHGASESQLHSHSRSHRRNRGNSLLSPPFLPRIPSGTVVPRQSEYTSFDQDTASVGAGEQSHNQTSYGANQLVPSPSASRDALSVGKRTSTMNGKPASAHGPFNQRPRLVSRPTEILLKTTESYSLLHGILAEKDSRRIFYFMLLNLSFMAVQSMYGFLTGSLGLISDSIHMFFDCIALLVGICAAVMSKWPASIKFPYGYGKLDTLAGLANGIFLMLISVEIVYEAVERLFAGSDLSRTTELLVVSSLGLGVNLIGILAFEHGHHHHSHGHAHGYEHSHGSRHHHHSHEHDRNTSSGHTHSLSSASRSASPVKTHAGHTHLPGHHHGGENMQGIYLHIMADALGSVAVVISTLLVRLTGWNGFDPLASCIIAVLIFASAVPLVLSTAQTLLLSLDSDIEYNLRDVLGGVSATKGVVGYSVPKFWLEDSGKKEAGHAHTIDDHRCSESHSRHESGHHHHGSTDDHEGSPAKGGRAILGVMHVMVAQNADMLDVQTRLDRYLDNKGMDVVVQLEREHEGRCWCGGGPKTG